MIVIKLAFYPMLFLGLVIAIAVPWVALVAFIALVVYGVTDTVRRAAAVTRTARQLEQKRAIAEEARVIADRLAESARVAADRYAIGKARIINKLTPEAVALFKNPN